ncbi:MAG: hypothetical protein MUD12_11680 [Spirochaetes bacterium]|jgi:hypothetical protein|nr:hypothetical protein [Spirochaetota bacterium]
MATFKGSLKRLETASKIALGAVSLILSIFLILLGNKILQDMSDWFKSPLRSDFENKAELKKTDLEIAAVNKRIAAFDDEKYGINRSLELAKRKYESEKSSFKTWVEARNAGESSAPVTARAVNLDSYRKIMEEWQSRLDALDEKLIPLEKEKAAISEKKTVIQSEDEKKFSRAMNMHNLKVFLFRLLFVGPVLGLAVLFFIKFRKNKFWPLFWGYILFALYAFFFGLVPYLPSFGGYIRYAAGIALSVFIGYYVVKQLAAYTEKKKAELSESTAERSRRVTHELAVKAYVSHSCPSCEKDFLMNNWRAQARVLKDTVTEDQAPDFCQHCGLALFMKCGKCGRRNFAHFPFCSSCGGALQG